MAEAGFGRDAGLGGSKRAISAGDTQFVGTLAICRYNHPPQQGTEMVE